MNERQVKKSAEYRKQYQEGLIEWQEFVANLNRLHLTHSEFTQVSSFTSAEEWCRIARKEAKK